MKKFKKCTLEECPRPYHGRGYCHMHYERWKAGGNPYYTARTQSVMAYSSAHERVKVARGPASQLSCQHCEGQAQQWALNWKNAKEILIDNRGTQNSGLKYSSFPEDYIALCISCHKKFDKQAPRV